MILAGTPLLLVLSLLVAGVLPGEVLGRQLVADPLALALVAVPLLCAIAALVRLQSLAEWTPWLALLLLGLAVLGLRRVGVLLSPRTYDAFTVWPERLLFGEPTGALLTRLLGLRGVGVEVLRWVHRAAALPALAVLVWAWLSRRGELASRLLRALIVLLLLVWGAQLLLPSVGPARRYAGLFERGAGVKASSARESAREEFEAEPAARPVRAAHARQATPSLGFALALLALLVAGLPRWLRGLTWAGGAAGLVGWLALGEHSALDLLLAVPLVLLARRLARAVPAARTVRRQLAAASPWIVLAIFFVSGFAGLLYEIVFEKQLALVLGSTAQSGTTVLATYMGGLALGAALGGKLADRVRRPLAAYALAELGVGLLCLLTPAGFRLAASLYPTWAAGLPADSPVLLAARIASGALVLFLPALLMGTTLPLLTRHLTRSLGEARARVALLYAANTLGAALGTLVTAYWVLPTFGRSGSTYLATVLNFCVAGVALVLAARARRSGTAEEEPEPRAPVGEGEAGIGAAADGDPPASADPESAREPEPDAAASAPTSWLPGPALSWAIPLLAGVMGAVTFGLEVVYIHLLAVVVGSSAYAFALMLFAFLLGLGGGSLLASRWRIPPGGELLRLGATQIALGALVLVTLLAWNAVPGYFAAYAKVSFARSFPERELVRFAVCLALLVGPSLLIGLSFPQAVSLAARGIQQLGRTVGRVSFFNTGGNILGSLLAGFVVLPALGSWRSLQLLACCSLGVGLVCFALAPTRRTRVAGPTAALLIAALGLGLLPSDFSMESLTTGANVYFSPQPYGPVVEAHEDLAGGLTSVHHRRWGRGVSVTVLTNGKFQGDDGPELPSQHLFALYPLLHRPAGRRALVIGLGTGVTAGTLLAAGFDELHVAELSAQMALVADRYFRHVNFDVLADPRTTLHLTDGRNLLLLDPEPYDLITIEITSVWFAGAASVYSAEFYELAASRLGPDGLLQQWVQLHHIDGRDLAAIVAAARRTFPDITLYWSGLQAAMVCSQQPNPVRLGALEALQERSELERARRRLPRRSVLPLAGQVLLNPEGVDAFLEDAALRYGRPWPELASDDDGMFLEYSTPRGNVRPYGSSTRANLRLLRPHGGEARLVGATPEAERWLRAAFRLSERKARPRWPRGARGEGLEPWLVEALRELGAPLGD